MAVSTDDGDMLRNPSQQEYPTLTRTTAPYIPQRNYDLAKGTDKHYQQQFSDMYFLRLAKLKPAVEGLAAEAWDSYEIAGDEVHKVDRVLDVRQGELCWVAGTIYMDMPLKPNILDDISKDHWIAAPPPREKYLNPNGEDKIMLEDESGRLRLMGVALEREMLVTGCIVAVMGTENANGDFEVIDIKVPDLPAHPAPEDLAPKPAEGEADQAPSDKAHGKVAIVSGLGMSGSAGDSLALDLLMEFLLGESTSPTLQATASQITRLIVAGNSIAEGNLQPDAVNPSAAPNNRKAAHSASKKYGYDSSAYNPAPTAQLDLFLSTLLPSLPVTLLPGASDPANVSIPQQPLHPALFPHSRAYASPPTQAPPAGAAPARKPRKTANSYPLHPTTNPTFFTLGNNLILGTSGQPTDDISKYISSTPNSSSSAPAETTLDLMEATLRWRLIAPTAPDTLWCYPYQNSEPFVLDEGWCPQLYLVGNQEAFGTRVVRGEEGQEVRCVSVPRFSDTGECVLVDLETREVSVVRFMVEGSNAGGVKAEEGGKGFFEGV